MCQHVTRLEFMFCFKLTRKKSETRFMEFIHSPLKLAAFQYFTSITLVNSLWKCNPNRKQQQQQQFGSHAPPDSPAWFPACWNVKSCLPLWPLSMSLLVLAACLLFQWNDLPVKRGWMFMNTSSPPVEPLMSIKLLDSFLEKFLPSVFAVNVKYHGTSDCSYVGFRYRAKKAKKLYVF